MIRIVSCKNIFYLDSFRVFNTGSPSYANIDSIKKINIQKLLSKLNIRNSNKKYLILIKHPLSSEIDQSYIQMKKSLEAIKLFCLKNKFNTVCIAPNSDPGSYEIVKAVKEYISEAKSDDKLRLLIVTDEPEEAKTFHTADRLREESKKLNIPFYLF